jgi:segregation and condensation protein B
MDMEDIKNKLEAILLLGGDEIKIGDLSKYFSLTNKEITDLLRDLKFERRHTGISLEIVGDNTFLTTNPLYGEDVSKFFERGYTPRKLSAAALETLSIIAYKQPITKGEISNIRRGMAVDGVMFSLLEKKFVRICGKKQGPGRPNLYEITDKFLGYLSINSVEELPNYQEVKNGTYNIAEISKFIQNSGLPEENLQDGEQSEGQGERENQVEQEENILEDFEEESVD